MPDDLPLSRELGSLLMELPHRQLVEVMRRSAVGAFEAECRAHLGDTTLPQVVESIFPRLPKDRIDAVAREISLCAIRNKAWGRLLSRPGHREIQMRCVGETAIRQLRERNGPAVVALWHHGAPGMAPLGLQCIGVPSLIISRSGPSDWLEQLLSKEMKVIASGDSGQGALVLKESLERLKEGGVVAMAIDGGDGKRATPLSFLGRKLVLARGIAVLSRLTGAPIFPALATWGTGDWSFEFRLFEPVAVPPVNAMAPDDWEREAMATTARRFEAIVRSTPGQCRLEILSQLFKAPVI